MKELSEERARKLYTENAGFEPGQLTIKAIQEAYRIGQQEAGVGVDEQRFQAAKDAMKGMLSSGKGFDASDSVVAYIAKCAVKQADALIAELNRTASDAEKGGEG